MPAAFLVLTVDTRAVRTPSPARSGVASIAVAALGTAGLFEGEEEPRDCPFDSSDPVNVRQDQPVGGVEAQLFADAVGLRTKPVYRCLEFGGRGGG